MPPRPKPRDKGYGARLKLEQAIEKLREADLTPITGDDPLIVSHYARRRELS